MGKGLFKVIRKNCIYLFLLFVFLQNKTHKKWCKSSFFNDQIKLIIFWFLIRIFFYNEFILNGWIWNNVRNISAAFLRLCEEQIIFTNQNTNKDTQLMENQDLISKEVPGCHTLLWADSLSPIHSTRRNSIFQQFDRNEGSTQGQKKIKKNNYQQAKLTNSPSS